MRDIADPLRTALTCIPLPGPGRVHHRPARALATLLLACAPIACGETTSAADAPVLLQGALRMETARLAAALRDPEVDSVGAWVFWRGTIDGHRVVVSRTGMGGTNAAAATAIAIQRYRPRAIINAGTSSGHDPALRVGDIVLGIGSVSLAAFRTPARRTGAGSRPLEWRSLDLVERPGDSDGDLHEGSVTRFPADSALLTAARAAAPQYTHGRVLEGLIGSSDVWNEEMDRIAHLRRTFGTSVEEMATAPAAQVARMHGIPFVGIRVVSNVASGAAFDARTAEACQDFVLQVLRRYLAR